VSQTQTNYLKNMIVNILDPKASTTMNIFIVIANIINISYNIPQMVHTYKTKSTKDFDVWFIVLRCVGNIIWLVYSIYLNIFLMMLNNLITVFSSIFIGYYKILEILEKKRLYKKQINDYNLLNTIDCNENNESIV
jgi:MtN3 and saliva related transmembrane protein